MSSVKTLLVPVFETVEDERDFWKKGYYQLDKELQALKSAASSQNNSLEGEEDCEMPSAKRQRIDEKEADDSMDPFKKLGDDELFAILKYLTGKELLQAMVVSKGWKQFIEGQKILMNRAMNEVVVEPWLDDHSHSDVRSLADNIQPRRPYKHMRAPFYLRKRFTQSFNYYMQFEPVRHFASDLVTLEIYDTHDADFYKKTDDPVMDELFDVDPNYEFEGCEFPKLKMLKYSDASWYLNRFSFPLVTHLLMEEADEFRDNDYPSHLSSALKSFPKLKYFSVDFHEKFFSDQQTDPDDYAIAEDSRPKIQQISISCYFGRLMKEHQNSLHVVEIGDIDVAQISWLLRDLKVLKKLTFRLVSVFPRHNSVILQQNHSIETLKMKAIIGLSRQFIDRLLPALPSLKELVLFETINAQIVELIASNMGSLKRLVCKEIREQTIQAYQEIRRNAYRYKNSAFELVAEPDHDFDEINKNFNQEFK